MKLTTDRNFSDGTRKVVLELTEAELQRAQFDGLDFRLMRECEESEMVSDKLLGLEMIARRIERSHDGEAQEE